MLKSTIYSGIKESSFKNEHNDCNNRNV